MSTKVIQMVVIVRVLVLFCMVSACGPQVREITYPSPCMGGGCVTTGWEVWGTEEQVQQLASKCKGLSAHVTVDQHKDYGVVRCYTPEKAEPLTVVSVERPTDEIPPAEIQKVDQQLTSHVSPKKRDKLKKK